MFLKNSTPYSERTMPVDGSQPPKVEAYFWRVGDNQYTFLVAGWEEGGICAQYWNVMMG
ncbi:MAG: hypothetical protein IPO07_13950 [Haliscomenobacter sp.]|nr:hypothetical protein [Haliscomenobacter sp.]MBK9489753.1 hypothetical protein [Haliscomenobacter sp.]